MAGGAAGGVGGAEQAMLLKIVALLSGLFGVASLFWLFVYLAYGPSFRDIPRQHVLYYASLLGFWIFNAVTGFALLYGLWTARRWARWLAICVCSTVLIVGIYGFVSARLREPGLRMTPRATVFGLGCLALFGGVMVICARRPRQ